MISIKRLLHHSFNCKQLFIQSLFPGLLHFGSSFFILNRNSQFALIQTSNFQSLSLKSERANSSNKLNAEWSFICWIHWRKKRMSELLLHLSDRSISMIEWRVIEIKIISEMDELIRFVSVADFGIHCAKTLFRNQSNQTEFIHFPSSWYKSWLSLIHSHSNSNHSIQLNFIYLIEGLQSIKFNCWFELSLKWEWNEIKQPANNGKKFNC